MAVTFQYDAAQRLLLVTFSGDLRDAELADLYRRTREFSARYPVQRAILDGLKIQAFEGSAEMVRSLAHQPSMFPETADRCIVVQQDALFGMARMYQMLGGESRDRLRVVRSMQDAYAHLQLQTPLQLEALEG